MTLFFDNWTHAGVFGTTGVGKSTLCELLCELQYLNKKSKIIDLQNNKYIEAIGFMIPTRIERFKRYFEERMNFEVKGKSLKPRAFPVEIYHPIVKGLPQSLPACFKLYTLPIDFFTYEDVLRVLTNDDLSYPAYTDITQAVAKIKNKESFYGVPAQIAESVNKKIVRFLGLLKVPFYIYKGSTDKSAPGASRPLFDLARLGIFGSVNSDTALTNERLRNILRNRKTITAFSLKFLEEQRYAKLKASINLYLLHKIIENSKSVGGNIILYARDASELWPNPRATSDRGLKVLGERAEDSIKDCRKAGVKVIADVQSATMLAPGVVKELGTRFILRHHVKIEELMEFYAESPGINDKEWVKNIKCLINYRYYISKEGLGIEDNPLEGKAIKFKFSGHLRENENELKFLRKIIPKAEWKRTYPSIKGLADEWRETYRKRYKGALERGYNYDMERVRVKKYGLAVSQSRIIISLHKRIVKNGENNFIRLKNLYTGLKMKRTTCQSALEKLSNVGHVSRDGKGQVKLTDGGIEIARKLIKDRRKR